MLAAAERWGGGADERPFLPRAFSVMRRERRPPRVHARGRRARHDTGSASCARATACGSPARSGSASRRRATAAARCWSAAASAPRRWRSGRTPSARRGRSLGFRDAEHAAGASLLRDARVATDDGSVGHKGPVTDLLLAELGRSTQIEVYACGPPGMLEAVRAICAEHEIPAQLALESGMACGYGACFGCVVPTTGGYVRLCVDGPDAVLDARRSRGAPMTFLDLDATRSSTRPARSTRSPLAVRSVTPCSSASRSPRS